MTRDVVEQLQRISAQQSRIRDMKNKIAAFSEVLGRQNAAFSELAVVGRYVAGILMWWDISKKYLILDELYALAW